MKIILLSLSLIISAFSITGQTATNFNCNDCASVNHNLFTELNSNKIIVITWVMPCGACIAGGTAAQNAVLSFSTSNPGQVFHYIADDLANTTCATLRNWDSINNLSPDAKFSNSAVNMSGYGTVGMPKVVVLGGASHTVYYNQNGGAVTQSGIQTAINNALAAIATGVKENDNRAFSIVNIFPNPAKTAYTLSFNLSKNAKVKIEIQNQLGQKVSEVFNSDLQKGENTLNVNTSELTSGNYFINFSDGEVSKKVKLLLVH